MLFLKNQLPKIKAKLDKLETQLNVYRQAYNSIDLNLEAKSILQVSVSLETQLNELTFKESEASKLYTKAPPACRVLLEKRQTLLKEKENLAHKINALLPTLQQILSLIKNVRANNAIYMALLNKQQELGIVKASAVGHVRIIDHVMTDPDPIKPKILIIIFGSFLFGIILSSGFVILKNALRRTIEHVEKIEDLGINVYASIPLSDWQIKKDNVFKRMRLRHKKRGNARSNQLVSIHCPTDLSVESLRRLRTSLYFAMMESKNKVLAISGCTPEIGKTFITTNLSVVIADTEKKSFSLILICAKVIYMN